MANSKSHDGFTRLCKWGVLAVLLLLGIRGCAYANVHPGNIGVRYDNFSGINEEDLDPGMHYSFVGIHTIYELPQSYLFLDYAGDNALQIRTVDNNIVTADVTIPVRIKEGEAFQVVDDGNHLKIDEDTYRFMQLADQSVRDTLRDRLATLRSSDWYVTDKRLAIVNGPLPEGKGKPAVEVLNEKLAKYHLETPGILIRSYRFRVDYENQLAQIQFNEQQKLLDGAKSQVAAKQQALDNYTNDTNAKVEAKRQDWDRRLANLDRAYQVGIIDTKGDLTPGATRRALAAMPAEEKIALKIDAARLLGKWKCDKDADAKCNPTVDGSGRVPDGDAVTDEHLLGVQPIIAETTEYFDRVQAESSGIKARLSAEGDSKVAQVQGAYESKLNALLDSPAGRAYVAYNAAANVNFAKTLTFQSKEGIPSVLRLYDFARTFMGR